METAVIDGMKDYLRRPDVHYALAMADYNASRGSSAQSPKAMEKQVRELAREKAHYDEQATAFELTPRQREIAKKKAHDLDLKLAELNAELRQAAVVMLPSKSGIVAAFGQILAILDEIETFAEKRKFIEATVQRIATDGHQVKVTGVFDVQALANQTGKGGTYTIRHLYARFGDHDVSGLHVAMHDAFGMRRGQGIGDFRAMEQGLFDREPAAFQLFRQRFAGQQLHHQVVGADVVERTDVAVIQGGDRAGFSLESLVKFLTAGFDRDFSGQTGIGGPVDFSHPSRADLPFDPVRAQLHSSPGDRPGLKKARAPLPGGMFQRRSVLGENGFDRRTQFRVGLLQSQATLGGRQLHDCIVQFLQLPPASGSHARLSILVVSRIGEPSLTLGSTTAALERTEPEGMGLPNGGDRE
jgi:hypothetical protein